MPHEPNNLADIRRTFNGGQGERQSHNVALQLCDEIETLRKANIALGRLLCAERLENSELKKQLADSIKP